MMLICCIDDQVDVNAKVTVDIIAPFVAQVHASVSAAVEDCKKLVGADISVILDGKVTVVALAGIVVNILLVSLMSWLKVFCH